MSISPNKSAPLHKTLLPSLLFSFLAGAIVAILLGYFYLIGGFERWHFVFKATDKSSEFVGYDAHSIYIRSMDAKIYDCPIPMELYRDMKGYRCTPVENPNFSVPKPCDYHQIPFIPLVNPPKDIVSCGQFSGWMLDLGYSMVVILDTEGNLWAWSNEGTGLEIIIFPILFIIGGLSGMLIGAIIWNILTIRQNK